MEAELVILRANAQNADEEFDNMKKILVKEVKALRKRIDATEFENIHYKTAFGNFKDFFLNVQKTVTSE